MTNLRKLFYLLIVGLLISECSFAQEVTETVTQPERIAVTYPNIIKVNSLALAFNNISLVYERALLPRFSAQIGVGYKYTGAEPKLFEINNSVINVSMDKIRGYSISPEARYYLKACDLRKLEGFYAGIYLRYTGYNTSANFEFLPENNITEKYKADLKLNEFGAGFQLGYQLLIKERFSVDFLFFGPRFSSYHLSYEFDNRPGQQFLDNLSDYLNEVIDRFGFDYNVEIQQIGDTKARTSFTFANTRFGISLGFAF